MKRPVAALAALAYLLVFHYCALSAAEAAEPAEHHGAASSSEQHAHGSRGTHEHKGGESPASPEHAPSSESEHCCESFVRNVPGLLPTPKITVPLPLVQIHVVGPTRNTLAQLAPIPAPFGYHDPPRAGPQDAFLPAQGSRSPPYSSRSLEGSFSPSTIQG